MLRASVIVPARDAEDTLPRTLAALASQRIDGEFEVIVVDDGSSDSTAEIAREAGVRVLGQPPSGPAVARNLGVREARGAMLALCDADVFPVQGWLQAGIDALGDAELVQGKVLPEPGVRFGPFDRSIWVTFAPGLWEAANLFVRRELFERLGGFEEWIAPARGKALGEDVWFGYRALRADAKWAFCDRALVHHAVFARSAGEHVAERLRLRFFPAFASRMPELRRTFLYRRAFLNRRTARFDLALAGASIALARRSPRALTLALPYAADVVRQARRAEPVGSIALVDIAADLVGLLAMLYGSFRYRSPVL